jgi:uncharacterized protein (TIGR02246 family)
MRTRVFLSLAVGLTAVLAASLVGAKARPPAQKEPAAADAAKEQAQAGDDVDRPEDKEAIRNQSQEFTRAFAKGDAKAIAAMCTPGCEYFDDDTGELFRGRAAIEKSFADLFKHHPHSKIEDHIESIRFLARDIAVVEGTSRLQTPGPTLPSSTHYRAMHVREDGRWYVAMIQEGGGGEDKLEDLGWLLGNWGAKSKDRQVQLSFAWNDKKSRILCHYSAKENGKVTASGTQIIGWDPQRGQLRSWNFDDEGGHGQSLWFRDGHRWIQDSVGVLPDGTPTAANNIINRINDDEFTWRSTDRRIGDQEAPDTDLIRVTRIKAAKQERAQD